MRSQMPTLHCDAEDGDCGIWDVDYYESCASSVGGVQITREQRAPGWTSASGDDFCPEHASEATPTCDGCGNTPAAPTCPHVQQCRACGPALTGCWECVRDERSEG